MKFEKVIGKFDPAVVKLAEDNLSAVFIELSLKYDNFSVGSSGLGGDPLIFNLIYAAVEHICTDKIGNGPLHTAATDGKKFYWNPHFVNKLCPKGKPKLGLRFVVAHEAWHSIYMHPNRRSTRNPRLWNIAVDYKVNSTIMEDIKARGAGKDPDTIFKNNLGDYISLQEYVQFLKDPFNPPKRLAHLNPTDSLYKTPDELRAGDESHPSMYFSDVNLPPEMKRPETIYEHLYSLLPRCEECGTIGRYKMPDKLPQDVLKRKADLRERLVKEQEKKLPEAKQKLEEQIKDLQDQIKKEKDKEEKEKLEEQLKQLQAALEDIEQDIKDLQEYKKNMKSNAQKQHNHSKPQAGQKGKKQKGKKGSPDKEEDGEEEGQQEGQDQNSQQGNQGQPQQGQQGCPNHGCNTCGKGKPHSPGAQMPNQGQPGQSGQPGQGNQPGEGNSIGDWIDDYVNGEDQGYFDVLGARGNTLDDHVDADMSEEELAKRIADAVEGCRKMAGKVPGGLEDELGELLAPKLTWQDFMRMVIVKQKEGRGKSDWNKPKTRQMFAGLYTPKQRRKYVRILAACDSSGSMSADDIAFGVSQLQVLDDSAEGVLVFWDTVAYWKDKTVLSKFKKEDLQKAKVSGRGGTCVSLVFNEYEDKDKCGPVDLIVIMTDGYLYDGELKDVKKPKVPVIWLITSDNKSFSAPFGRIFNLHNM